MIAPGHGFPAGGVFTAALDAVVVMDSDGRVRDWNPSAEDVFGYSWHEAVGNELAELIIPPAYRAAHREAFGRYLETREATILDRRLRLTALRRGGTEFPVELTITRVPDIEPPLFAGFVRDLSGRDGGEIENEKLQQRLAFLAHAGLQIDVSLDMEETLRRLVGLTVPELAEVAVIDLLADDGSIRGAVAAAGRDAESAAALEQMRSDHPLDPRVGSCWTPWSAPVGRTARSMRRNSRGSRPSCRRRAVDGSRRPVMWSVGPAGPTSCS